MYIAYNQPLLMKSEMEGPWSAGGAIKDAKQSLFASACLALKDNRCTEVAHPSGNGCEEIRKLLNP